MSTATADADAASAPSVATASDGTIVVAYDQADDGFEGVVR